MKFYGLDITIIESQEDRDNYFKSHTVKPPNKYCAAFKGCFAGIDCATLFAIPEGNESLLEAIIRTVQEEVDDSTLFAKDAKSKVLK